MVEKRLIGSDPIPTAQWSRRPDNEPKTMDLTPDVPSIVALARAEYKSDKGLVLWPFEFLTAGWPELGYVTVRSILGAPDLDTAVGILSDAVNKEKS